MSDSISPTGAFPAGTDGIVPVKTGNKGTDLFLLKYFQCQVLLLFKDVPLILRPPYPLLDRELCILPGIRTKFVIPFQGY